MGPCCVEGCEVTEEETYYFEFPTSRLLRRRWLDLTGVAGKLPLGAVVCSKHFRSEDYELVRGKVRLKRKVVPSLLLNENSIPKPKENSPEPTKSPPICPKSPKSPIPSSPKSPIPSSPKSPIPSSPKSPIPSSPKSPIPPKTPISRSPKSPLPPKSPKVTAACDSTVTDLPDDEQAEKQIDKQTNEHSSDARISTESADICKVVHHDKGRWDCFNIDLNNLPLPDPKQDIEDMITNYHIKNKPNTAHLPDLPLSPSREPAGASEMETIEIDDKDPVFIEIPVDKDNTADGGGSRDCLMLLESVLVDVDPSSLMLPDRDDDDDLHDIHDSHDKKDDPISLLTSSDEDDVIIQEPHIDTVEVSDETDEDDVPLVKLLKKTPHKKKLKKKSKKLNKEDFENVMWKMYDFYCIQCHYSTNSSVDYNNHMNEHSTVLQVCPMCGYTSASKTMFSRHIRKHREEKKFRCHICDYRAKHNMSLIYHLKSHDSANLESAKRGFKCTKCGFQSDVKATVLKHVRLCSTGVKKYSCDKCVYETKRWSDLKRHLSRRHKDFIEDEDLLADGDWS